MDSANSSSATGSRNLRKKARKVYRDDGLDDDEIDGMQMFDLEEKINRVMSAEKFYLEMDGCDLTLKYFQKNGFTTPILIREKSGLGLRMPSQNFTVNDVKRCVGSSRVLNVMDVSTQKDMEMTLKEWVKYYENPERQRLLNVISLEFSHTKLENYVDQPEVVHQMDWVDLVWPWHLKEFYPDPITGHGRMLYPKVQKYCLMSVGGCYTDFHIDMGGTSVWYHILRGKKIFWLIPPTEENLVAYENWTLSGRQGDVFFGDIVSDCYRITLEAGFTFLIPTGWIHAVYTPEDSLVFGGNFLHCFNIRLQLRIWEVEYKTKVPSKFRYPLFAEIHWYVLERYVSCLLGKSHRIRTAEEQLTENGDFEAALKERLVEELSDTNGLVDSKIILGNETVIPDGSNMLNGDSSSGKRQNIFDVMSGILTPDQTSTSYQPQINSIQPDTSVASDSELTSNSVSQCTDRSLVGRDSSGYSVTQGSIAGQTAVISAQHSQGSSQSAPMNVRHRNMARYEVEGLLEIVRWLENLPTQRRNVPRDISNPDVLLADTKMLIDFHRSDDPDLAVTGKSIIKLSAAKVEKQKKKPSVPHQPKVPRAIAPRAADAGVWKYRRVRCKQCEPCTRTDCRECLFCRDMIKYGGPGRMKQTCVSRQCLGTVLPASAVCEICRQAKCSEMTIGRSQRCTPATVHPTYDEMYDGEMMECRVCFEVVHPACLRVECVEVEGRDLTHSGIVDEDVPSSWECARCCTEGKAGQGKHRAVKPTYTARPHRRRTDGSSDSSDNDDEPYSVVDKPRGQRSTNGDLSRTRSRSVDEEECADSSSKLMKMNSVSEAESIAPYADNNCNPTVQLQLMQQQQLLHYQHQLQQQQQQHQYQLQQQQHQQLQYQQQQHQLLNQQQQHQLYQHQLQHQSSSARIWSPIGDAGLRPPPELPTKVNSRGREISTPRRYLL